jgi:predicted nucleotidyltransferase
MWPPATHPGSLDEGGADVVQVPQGKREAIAELRARTGVARLDVFGSALRDDFRPGGSDVDLLVDFAPMDGYAKAVAYFDLLDDLRGLLGVEVDLVMAGAVKNRYIARDREQTRQLLYAA